MKKPKREPKVELHKNQQTCKLLDVFLASVTMLGINPGMQGKSSPSKNRFKRADNLLYMTFIFTNGDIC